MLKENIEHHVEEEEGEMFKKARKVLSEEEIEVLGTRMEKARASQGCRGSLILFRQHSWAQLDHHRRLIMEGPLRGLLVEPQPGSLAGLHLHDSDFHHCLLAARLCAG